jgi:hypothetical protein
VSVVFSVEGWADRVEMSNATARVVLGLLALDAEGPLEGRLGAKELSERLATVTRQRIWQSAVPPRQLGPRWRDEGCSARRLTRCILGLAELSQAAAVLGEPVVWE